MDRSDRINAVIDAALVKRIVGCVVLVLDDGREVYRRAAGFADREARLPVEMDTIFRLASVTKPIVAATALKMIDLGLLSLDDPVTSYLPWFTPKAPDGSTPQILIRHLLTHTSGLTYVRHEGVSTGADPGPLIPLEENLKRLARYPLAFAPGTGWHYGMSIDLLGGVLASINKSTLGEVVARYVTGPLEMTDTIFGVADPSRFAVAYGDGKPVPIRMADPQPMPEEDGTLQTFSPKRIFQSDAPQSGGAGMAGTAGDLAKLLSAIGTDFFKPATRDAAFSNQIGNLPRDVAGQRFGFVGAIVDDASASGWPYEGLIQWGGVWGNNWIMDPEKRRTLIVYTNTMREGCNGPFRDEMRDAVFG